jgi:iron complex outermembrane receptor protein
MLYGSYSRGFKAGGIDLNGDAGGGLFGPPSSGFAVQPRTEGTYEPEVVDSYELGFKTDYLDGRGRLNVSYFIAEYTDVQSAAFTGTAFVTYNAPEVTVSGIELENTFRLTDSITTTFNVTNMLENSFSDDPNPLQPNLVGRELKNTPEWAGTLGLAYESDLNSSVGLFGNLNLSYMGKHYVSESLPMEEEFALVQARVGLRGLDEKWEVSLSCSNCADEEYLVAVNSFPLQLTGHLMALQGMPRTYLASVKYNFF